MIKTDVRIKMLTDVRWVGFHSLPLDSLTLVLHRPLQVSATLDIKEIQKMAGDLEEEEKSDADATADGDEDDDDDDEKEQWINNRSSVVASNCRPYIDTG